MFISWYCFMGHSLCLGKFHACGLPASDKMVIKHEGTFPKVSLNCLSNPVKSADEFENEDAGGCRVCL